MAKPTSKQPMSFMYKGKNWPMMVTEESVDAMINFEVREDDVFVDTYPKSGTHWMMELVGLVLNNGDPNKIKRRVDLPLEFAEFKEMKELAIRSGRTPVAEGLKNVESPRAVLTHTHLSCFPVQAWKKQVPIIYVARNPRDVAVSMFNFIGKSGIFQMDTFDQCYELFDAGLVGGSWFDHVQEFWPLREKDHVLFVTYEEMQKDIRSVIVKVVKLLKREATDELVERIVENLSIGKMKENIMKAGETIGTALHTVPGVQTAQFMNKGVSGRWKEYFTVALNERFEKTYAEKMKDFKGLSERLEI